MNACRNVMVTWITMTEFDHLSSKYGHLFKKLALEEFQDLLDNMNFPADLYISNIIKRNNT